MQLLNDDHREIVENNLLELLPHGSGIDCKWDFVWLKNGKLICKNSYHCMTEEGYYDGFADFSIKFDVSKSLHSFDLSFNGKFAQYQNNKYVLREYLEYLLIECLPSDLSLYSLSIERG